MDRILILDFGSQYTQLIARRIRELQVFSEIEPWDISLEEIIRKGPKGIIFSGGPATVTESQSPKPCQGIYDLGIPILGICYGMQCIAEFFGGAVNLARKREYGHAQIQIHSNYDLFHQLCDSENPKAVNVWMSHGDSVTRMPPDFSVSASSENSPYAAIVNEQKQIYGVQFHPEVTHTQGGERILEQFAKHICGCEASWTTNNIIDDGISQVRRQVGDDGVILGLSGGVDSSVVAGLLHRAIGDQLTCIFVDNGLLRLKEADQVMQTFSEHMGIRVKKVDASQQFLSRLKGITDPEEKRRIIGNVFIEVFERAAGEINNVKWLAQGTIYPDVIESAATKTGAAKVIKSHHNVGGLPEHMHLKLVEPLKELFKDEVRAIGIQLGLPEQMVYRHPFPGPGLGVRILGEVKQQYADTLRLADDIFIQELHRNDLYDKYSQAFAVFLPVKSVGVIGDNRSYEYVVCLRAVETTDFMTATWAPIPHDVLSSISNRIINEVPGISRVTYDISSKPPATIEWE